MRVVLITFLTILLVQIVGYSQVETSQDSICSIFKGQYLGKEPPGLIAKEFDSGQLTDMKSFNFSFSPDGKELFFLITKEQKKIHIIMKLNI